MDYHHQILTNILQQKKTTTLIAKPAFVIALKSSKILLKVNVWVVLNAACITVFLIWCKSTNKIGFFFNVKKVLFKKQKLKF